MNCHRVQSLISAYVDCELPGVEMLAIRQHLNQCSECNSEFESLLSIKRAFGTMQPRPPAADLPVRIFQRLDQVSPPPHEQFLASLIKRLNFFPAKMRFAAVGLAMFTFLFMVRSSQMVPRFPAIPLSPVAGVSGLAETKPVEMLPITSMVEAVSLDTSQPGADSRPWGLSEYPEESTDMMAGSGIVLASCSTTL